MCRPKAYVVYLLDHYTRIPLFRIALYQLEFRDNSALQFEIIKFWHSHGGIAEDSDPLRYDAVWQGEWFWDMTTCGWVSGSGIRRRVVGFVVLGYDDVWLGEWFWELTPCIWVNGSGLWYRVFRWVVLEYDAAWLGVWFWDMTLRRAVSGSGVWRRVVGWMFLGYDAV